ALTLTLTDATKLNSIDISGLKGITSPVAINLANVKHTDNKLVVDIQGSDAAETITANTADSAVTAITLSGDLGGGANTVTVAPTSGATAITSIDLSGLSATGGTLTSTITLHAANTAIESVKGSLGGDNITVVGDNKAVAIDLGKDTAVDTVNVSAAKIADISADSKIAEDLVSITNALSGDQIVLKGVTSIANRGEITGATLKDAIGKLGASGNGTVVAATAEVFVWNGNTYVLDAAAGSAFAANDILIELTGIVTFSDAVNANTITVA
ncbi:hypothetical protein CFT12S02225_08910, partial [Campylobacter fetus subsp. testudinum]